MGKDTCEFVQPQSIVLMFSLQSWEFQLEGKVESKVEVNQKYVFKGEDKSESKVGANWSSALL